MSHDIKDTDHGFKDLLKRLTEAAEGKSLTVGVHEAEGAELHDKEPEAVTYDNAGRAHHGGRLISKKKAAEITAKADAKRKAKEKKAGPPLTVIQVAAFHEFGTSRTPRRSFIADWADEGENKHKDQLRKMAAAVLKGTVKSFDQALERLGNLYVGEIQVRIARGIDPPLTEATIKRKGSSKQLIDTGQLRSSIRFRIDEEGGE